MYGFFLFVWDKRGVNFIKINRDQKSLLINMMTGVNMVFPWSWSVFFACIFVESGLTAIFCELIHVYSVFETANYLSQDFLRKLRLLDSGEIVKTLVARTFWENSEMWEKTQKCEKNSKTEVSLRKFYFGGTVGWEKLKFSEKSQIWENLSVGGPQARRYRRDASLDVH